MTSRISITICVCLIIGFLLPLSSAAQDSLNLSTLNGYNHGFYVDGASVGDEIAKSMATGDINGDGIDDIIIGAQDAFSAGPTAGNTYVIYGKANQFQDPIGVNELDGSNGFVVYGDVMNDNMGLSVAAGDFDGDGKDDLIMGAPLADPFATQSGEVYLLLSDELDGSSSYSIDGISSSLYLTIFGSGSTAIDNLGQAVAAGDVNNDGYDDILIGALNADTDEDDFAGQAYLVYGFDIQSLGFLDVDLVTDPPGTTTFSGSGGTNFLGSSVHIADILAGPTEEIIIGAIAAGDHGKVYVVAGLSAGRFTQDEYDIESTAAFTFSADSTGNVGRSKSIASGDINGNGQLDLILTASFNAADNAGKAYVILDPTYGTLSPSDLDGTNGFVVNGGIDGERLGSSVATGDINNDGYDDIILGAVTANPDGETSAGKTYVFFGRNGGFLSEYDINEMTKDEGFVLNGNNADDFNGFAVSSGDYNSDGYSDIATGSPFDAFSRGRAYIFLNSNSQKITGDEGFRMLSSPASGKVLPNIYNPLATQGFPGADIPEASETNMWVWDVSTQQWQTIDSLASAQQAGDGILYYTFADDDFDGTDDDFPKLLQTRGSFVDASDKTPNKGAFDIFESLPDGDFQLVGNPYGRTINWNAASGWTKTNLSETIYIWSDSASNYNGAWLNWNGTTGSLGSGEISSFQSFFVQAEGGSGALSVNEDVVEGTSSLLKNESNSEYKELILELKNEQHSQKLFISFQDEASLEGDRYDGHFLTSLSDSYLSFAASSPDGDLLTLNALPSEIERTVTIPLFLEAVNTNNEVTLKILNTLGFSENWSFQITDHVTDEVVALSALSELNLIIPQTDTENEYRYSLQIIPGVEVSSEIENQIPDDFSLDQNYPNPFNPTTQIKYAVPEAGNVELKVYDMLGREVATLLNKQRQAGRYTVHFDASELASGIYIYRLQSGSEVLTKRMTLIK